jgi:Flp pilus assembly protein TadD
VNRSLGIATLVALAVGLGGCGRVAILTDPLSAAEHNDLGVAYEARGERDLAEREYRRALAHDRHFARARVNLGNCMAGRGQWSDAEREYRRALQDVPGDSDARNNLAVALVHLGRANDEAEWLARSAVALATTPAADSTYRQTLVEVFAARARR